MAKKKRRKKRPTRPTGGAATQTQIREQPAAERATSQRALRKEEARKERERRIRQARRAQRNRRLARWGIAIAIIGGTGGFIAYRVVQDARLEDRAAQVAQSLGCTPISPDQPDLTAGLTSAQIHSEPFTEGSNGVPATNGRHSSPLPPEPAVYDQPIPEENAIHNLEHGYVIIYYAAEGENALAEGIRNELEDYASGQTKVLMAPYEGLANSFDLVAWRKIQTCDPGADASGGDAVTVAESFVQQFRAGGLAPEPNGV
jgi:Protein of unknown function (DUF3105)